MDAQSILRNNVLYQKSWTGWRCSHVIPSEQKNVTEEMLRSCLPNNRKTTKKGAAKTDRPDKRKSDSRPEKISLTLDALSIRRSQRADRSRPWNEDTPKSPQKQEQVELHYGSCLPKDKWLEFRAREYVANPRYGHLYEVRKEKRKSEPKEEPVNWLWENQFRLWRLEIDRTIKENGKMNKITLKDIVNNRISLRGRKQVSKYLEAKPHADLFAAYHNEHLLHQRRQLAAVVIQRHVRGWLVRMRLKRMKRRALLSLGCTWSKITRDYRQLIARIQSRHGIMKTGSPFMLSEMEEYIERREKYERAFQKVAFGDKLSRDQLEEFFNEAGHYPTEGEISTAFNSVFKGSGTMAEVIFVLDCSTSLGIVNFHDQMTFVKDVVRSLDVAPDRVRVGLVPYNTDVFETFGLLQFTSRQQIITAIDKIRFRHGLTHTDKALKIMRDMFRDSRPGVQKVAMVITDGQSRNTELTELESKRAAKENIKILAIGVGHKVEWEELIRITGDKNRVYTCSDYRALVQLKDLISSKLCLPSDQTESELTSSRVSVDGNDMYAPHGAVSLLQTAGSLSQNGRLQSVSPYNTRVQEEPERMSSEGDSKAVNDPDISASDGRFAALLGEQRTTLASYGDSDAGSEAKHSPNQKAQTNTKNDRIASKYVNYKDSQSLSTTNDSGIGLGTGNDNESVQMNATDKMETVKVSNRISLGSSKTISTHNMPSSSSTSMSQSLSSNCSHDEDTFELNSVNQTCVDSPKMISLPSHFSSYQKSTSRMPDLEGKGQYENTFEKQDSDESTINATGPIDRKSARKKGIDTKEGSGTRDVLVHNRGTRGTRASSLISERIIISRESSFDDTLNNGDDDYESSTSLRGSPSDVCRGLSLSEVMDVTWTIYPPRATGLSPRKSRWIRPIVDGVEAWSFLDEKIINATDIRACLGLVVRARLEREGVITIPSDVRTGVEEVTSYEEAMEKIERYIEKVRRKKGKVEASAGAVE